jgi:hypothetical protein
MLRRKAPENLSGEEPRCLLIEKWRGARQEQQGYFFGNSTFYDTNYLFSS